MNVSRNNLFLLCLVFLLSTYTYSQKEKLHIFNNLSGRKIQFFRTYYYPDTTKTNSFILLEPGNGFQEANPQFSTFIRLDVMAIDDSSKEIIFSKQYTKIELEVQLFLVDIKSGYVEQINVLHPSDRLSVKISNYYNLKYYDVIFKKTSDIEFKLKKHKKLKGSLYNFNKDSLTILDPKGMKHLISKNEVKRLKIYEDLDVLGSSKQKSKYYKVIDFKPVKQVLRLKENLSDEWTWE